MTAIFLMGLMAGSAIALIVVSLVFHRYCYKCSREHDHALRIHDQE